MVKDLADPFEMSLPAASKHLRILESAGLMKREIHGRSHKCALNAEHLKLVQEWIMRYHAFWNESLTSLANFAENETAHLKKDD